MDIQTTFYLFGIIFMSLMILLLLGVVILLFYIKKKITDTQQYIELKVDNLLGAAAKPVKAAADITAALLPKTSKRPKRRKRK